MADKLSAAQQRMRDLMRNTDIAKIVGATFAEVLVESMDAKQEAEHWKKCFNTVRDEIKVLAAIVMRQQGATRLVIKKSDLTQMPPDLELYVNADDAAGVRVYELRKRERTTN